MSFSFFLRQRPEAGAIVEGLGLSSIVLGLSSIAVVMYLSRVIISCLIFLVLPVLIKVVGQGVLIRGMASAYSYSGLPLIRPP